MWEEEEDDKGEMKRWWLTPRRGGWIKIEKKKNDKKGGEEGKWKGEDNSNEGEWEIRWWKRMRMRGGRRWWWWWRRGRKEEGTRGGCWRGEIYASRNICLSRRRIRMEVGCVGGQHAEMLPHKNDGTGSARLAGSLLRKGFLLVRPWDSTPTSVQTSQNSFCHLAKAIFATFSRNFPPRPYLIYFLGRSSYWSADCCCNYSDLTCPSKQCTLELLGLSNPYVALSTH